MSREYADLEDEITSRFSDLLDAAVERSTHAEQVVVCSGLPPGQYNARRHAGRVVIVGGAFDGCSLEDQLTVRQVRRAAVLAWDAAERAVCPYHVPKKNHGPRDRWGKL